MDSIEIIPKGVCADRIVIEVDNGVLGRVEFEGGCDGNGKALGRLLSGMRVEKAIELLRGVDCEGKGTSCADQFAQRLAEKLQG